MDGNIARVFVQPFNQMLVELLLLFIVSLRIVSLPNCALYVSRTARRDPNWIAVRVSGHYLFGAAIRLRFFFLHRTLDGAALNLGDLESHRRFGSFARFFAHRLAFSASGGDLALPFLTGGSE